MYSKHYSPLAVVHEAAQLDDFHVVAVLEGAAQHVQRVALPCEMQSVYEQVVVEWS